MTSALTEIWVRTTLRVLNERQEACTGFLVARPTQDGDAYRCFLITTRHVLARALLDHTPGNRVSIQFNTLANDGSLIGTSAELNLIDEAGSRRWREHPDPEVDVLAIEVTESSSWLTGSEAPPDLAGAMAAVTYELFSDQSTLAELDVSVGEDVLIIGYAPRVRHHRHHRPLVRVAMIASEIGDHLEVDGEGEGSGCAHTLRGFLIDGGFGVEPGSPVVLRPMPTRMGNGSDASAPTPLLLLGIVGDMTSTAAQPSLFARSPLAGLRLVFDAETIRETIELFFAAEPLSSTQDHWPESSALRVGIRAESLRYRFGSANVAALAPELLGGWMERNGQWRIRAIDAHALDRKWTLPFPRHTLFACLERCAAGAYECIGRVGMGEYWPAAEIQRWDVHRQLGINLLAEHRAAKAYIFQRTGEVAIDWEHP